MRTIAFHTLRSLLREKIIFNVFGITLLLLFFGYLASQLVYGHQERVMLDVGIMMNSLSVFAVAIGIGSRFFRQEIESKTIYLLLSRPISRTSFFLARFLGMSLFILLNFSILTLILGGVVKFLMGELSSAFFQSFVLTYVESLILLAGSLLFSFWMRPALVFMIMLALLFIGHNHSMIQSLQSSGISTLNTITPNLSLFLMSDRVYYHQALETAQFLNVALYGGCWLLFFLLFGNAVFSRKNL